jgi:hypothetical protein
MIDIGQDKERSAQSRNHREAPPGNRDLTGKCLAHPLQANRCNVGPRSHIIEKEIYVQYRLHRNDTLETKEEFVNYSTFQDICEFDV